MTKRQIGEKVYLPYTSISLIIIKEVRTGTLAEQEPGGRGQCRGYGRMLPSVLLFIAWSARFPVEPRTTSAGLASPTMG